jgi:hypothetical protein
MIYDLYQRSTTTVSCTPDDGCKWHPKYVEYICSEIKNIYCALLHFVGYFIYIYICLYVPGVSTDHHQEVECIDVANGTSKLTVSGPGLEVSFATYIHSTS